MLFFSLFFFLVFVGTLTMFFLMICWCWRWPVNTAPVSLISALTHFLIFSLLFLGFLSSQIPLSSVTFDLPRSTMKPNPTSDMLTPDLSVWSTLPASTPLRWETRPCPPISPLRWKVQVERRLSFTPSTTHLSACTHRTPSWTPLPDSHRPRDTKGEIKQILGFVWSNMIRSS